MKNKTKILIAGSLCAASFLLLTGIAFAQGMGGWGGRMMGHPPGIFGTVSAVNGTTLTVTSKGFGRMASTTAPTVYTVDASNATVTKNKAASSIAGIAVGDTVMISGTVNGTNITATSIYDGIPFTGPRGGIVPGAPRASFIQGNGEPIIGGTVTAINSSLLTVANKGNSTYTVDVSNAEISKGHATSSVANIAVGDNVVVQGTVNGTQVVASSVIDQPAEVSSVSLGARMGGMRGFLGNIGGFFHRVFGFF